MRASTHRQDFRPSSNFYLAGPFNLICSESSPYFFLVIIVAGAGSRAGKIGHPVHRHKQFGAVFRVVSQNDVDRLQAHDVLFCLFVCCFFHSWLDIHNWII